MLQLVSKALTDRLFDWNLEAKWAQLLINYEAPVVATTTQPYKLLGSRDGLFTATQDHATLHSDIYSIGRCKDPHLLETKRFEEVFKIKFYFILNKKSAVNTFFYVRVKVELILYI